MRASCRADLILDLITQVCGKVCRSLSSSFSIPCYLVPLNTKYSLHHSLLTHLQPMFLPHCERPSFTNIQNNSQNYNSVCLNLNRMIAINPCLQSSLNLFLNKILTVKFVPKYLNSSTLSKELLTVLTLWLLPAIWSRDMTMYLVVSEFTSILVSFLATTNPSVCFRTVFRPVY